MKISVALCLMLAVAGFGSGCKKDSEGEPPINSDPSDPADSTDPSSVDDPSEPVNNTCQEVPDAVLPEGHVWVCVTLDEEPAAQVRVMQGGAPMPVMTDESGFAAVPVELLGQQSQTVVASHPDARIKSVNVPASYAGEVLTIALTRFSRIDNGRYTFQDPGAPGDSPTTAQCGHCHLSQTEDWYASAHRTSASSPWVQQLYAGTSEALETEQSCLAAGGRWLSGLIPGTGESGWKCYLGHGTLPALNANCGVTSSCDTEATAFGGCADCHAPGINGVLGGRNLLDATGIEYEDGVHCDTCHRVESVDLDALEPGVAGRLKLMRPTEQSPSIGLGEYLPLTFGPRHDVPNPRMGSVQRDHFSNGQLCSGCHEYEQPSLVPGTELDASRWPDGRLPVHSTWSEWEQGPLGPEVTCLQCHMPPDAGVANSADFQTYATAMEGVSAGFIRVPGGVRQHNWIGPRTDGSRMLDLSAALFIEKQVQDSVLEARVTVKHVGPGHALPTGEPMRSMVLTVEARCETETQSPIGGDVVPDFGGYEEVRPFSSASDAWPGAQVGDVLRVVRRTGGHHDYRGFGPFGDGRFTPAQKGMPVEEWVGEVTVTGVSVSGELTLSAQLPEGDIVYRLRPTGDGEAIQAAGLPGFGFARVMVGSDGERMVPHFLAVDIASDNRLLPFDAWTSTHRFTVNCTEPVVEAVLRYRPIAFSVAYGKRSLWTETVMQEVRR